MQKRQLVLFTSDFPFGTGETFLETEIAYLSKGFDDVLVISTNTQDSKTRTLPSNCKVERLDLGVSLRVKIRSIFTVLSMQFWKERKIIKSVYGLKLSKGVLSTMLISLYRAKQVQKKVQELVKENHDASLCFYSYWCDDVAIGLALANRQNPTLKTMCRIHRWDVYFEESKVAYLPFRHLIAEHIGKIFSISQDGIDYANKVWKTNNPEKFHLSRLGIENEFPSRLVERDFLLLVSCSNLIPVKRVHLIAEALQQIKDKVIHWVHIGDGPERSRIEELIRRFPSNITVELKGRVPNSEIYSYYNEVRPDMFINVSSSEGVPVSIMEAMSFGIPVIATDVGGNREIVNEQNGVLIDREVSITALSTLIQDLNQQKDKKSMALATWKNNYNSALNYPKFIEAIKAN